jgi:protein phosphatase
MQAPQPPRPPQPIVLPEPCLVVLIGAAGAGKSTLAARLFPAGAILSSDAYRAIVAGDEADQRATRTAFAILDRELERRMATRRTTVIDATSVTPFARRGLLRRAAAHRLPAVAIVLDLDPALVLARNAARAGRVVPEIAIRRQLGDLARSLVPGVLQAEGFAFVLRITSAAELDALSVAAGP